MVIVPDDADISWKRQAKKNESVHGITIPLDIKVEPHSNFFKRVHLHSSMPGAIVREGICLYHRESVEIEDAHRWLAKAEEWITAMDWCIQCPIPLWESQSTPVFFAAEQTLKALLTYHDDQAIHQRKLGNLFKAGVSHLTLLNEFESACQLWVKFGEHYDDLISAPDPTEEEVMRGINGIKKMVQLVRNHLSFSDAEIKPIQLENSITEL